jgi:predicted GIY-YIG superfamily endonuclease
MLDTANDTDETKHFWLYVLALEQGKYYVGITSKTPEIRFKQHQKGFAGASWTKQYKPLSVIDSKDLGLIGVEEAQNYENKVVRRYIKEYGLNNVRGGDITVTDELIPRFGRLFSKDNWDAITVIVFLLVIMVIIVLYGKHR